MWVILWSWSKPGWDTTQVSGCPFMLRLGTRWNSEVTAAERECLKERLDVVPLTSVSQVTLGAGLPSAVQEAASVRPWPSSSAGPGFSEGRGGTADGRGQASRSSPPPSGGPAPPPVCPAQVQGRALFLLLRHQQRHGMRGRISADYVLFSMV